MSLKTQISNNEDNIKTSKKVNLFYDNILSCKCGDFHEFKIIFGKEHIIFFSCTSAKLSKLEQTKKIHKKCDCCDGEISLEKDYCVPQKSKTFFICANCKENNKYKDIGFKKKSFLTKISIILDENDKDDLRERMKDKFTKFINKNEIDNKNDFYNKNLSNVKLFRNFIIYLCYLRKIYNDKNIIYKIISNFLEYSEHLLDIALNNIEIYDLYHFNKETIIYSYHIDDDKRISLNEFKLKYTFLLDKCEKKKYLSQKMLELICKKYEQKDAISPEAIFNIKNKYLKQIKINIKKEVFSGASSAKLNYLTISSAFQEIKDELQLIKLKIGLNKLNGEIVIDNYLNSYLNIPAEFLSLRKSSSIILNKLIKKNHEKLNFIKPSKKIINSALDLIFKIKKNLDEGEVSTSLRDKLNKLESILSSYIKGKKNGKPLYKLKPPLIKLNKVERNLLSFILKNDTYKFSNKISVADSDDSDLDFIINFFFELKNKASETIHINEKENLQFYSLFKKLEDLPEKNEDDDLNQGLDKIKEVLKMDIKSDNVSYSALINLMFSSEKNDFLEKENKVDYLLTLVDVKDDNLCNIKNKYIKYKKSLEKLPEKLINIIDASYLEIDEEKYKKFINKYSIKKN